MKQLRSILPLLALAGLLVSQAAAASPAVTFTSFVYLPAIPNVFPLPAAIDPFTSGTVGYDISFPGCGDGPPPTVSSTGAPYRFAVVGVNGGRAFYPNPCLGDEFAHAAADNLVISFYMNINAPIGSKADHGNNGPRDTCGPGDDVCLSYNFGYNAAADAYNGATATLGPGAVAGRLWWLDVETANSWWTDQQPPPPNATYLDDQVVQGAIDYFHESGIVVGSYSIATMWQYHPAQRAAKGMGATSAPALRPLILGNFAPNIPEWNSGASDLPSAPSFCGGSSFTGGPTWLAQVPLNNFYDENYAC